MMVVFLLLGDDQSVVGNWKQIRVLIGKTGKKSLKRRIMKFNVKHVTISEESLGVARQLIKQTNPEDIKRISDGATVFYAWCKGVVEELDKILS